MSSKNITIIDFRSDTVSQPTNKMREAMANAIVGDDVCGEDPTVNELEQRCAQLFEKESALFVPSGTMGNLIAIMVHCSERGAEVIVGESSHIYLYEQGGAASIAGVLLSTIPNNDDGTFSLDALRLKIRGADVHEPKTTLAIVENTQNVCGGKVIALDWLKEFASICKSNGIKMHMDGARVFHAAEYMNISVADLAHDFDSITFCLSKSLCAPVGSVVVGSNQFIAKARRMRKVLGGGMRQAGILAAAALVALDDIVPNLGNDHVRMKRIAQAICDLKSPYLTTDVDNVHTNMCMIHFLQPNQVSANDFVKRISEITSEELAAGVTDSNGNGIILQAWARNEWNNIRLVIYYHIDDNLTESAIKKLQYCINELK